MVIREIVSSKDVSWRFFPSVSGHIFMLFSQVIPLLLDCLFYLINIRYFFGNQFSVLENQFLAWCFFPLVEFHWCSMSFNPYCIVEVRTITGFHPARSFNRLKGGNLNQHRIVGPDSRHHANRVPVMERII